MGVAEQAPWVMRGGSGSRGRGRVDTRPCEVARGQVVQTHKAGIFAMPEGTFYLCAADGVGAIQHTHLYAMLPAGIHT